MAPLYLVDASIYIFRSYYSIPTTFFAANGELANAVYGYTNFLLDFNDRGPELASFAFDESLVSCYRNEIYPEYKANRDLPDENLEFQLAACKRATELLGFHSLSLHDYEADDIIGTLQKQFGDGREVFIVTRDKDLGQLLREQDKLWDFAADAWSGRDDVREKFGVTPEQLADYLALAGDTVDNIPGAPGIGPKSAVALLNHFGSLEALLARVDEVPELKIRGAKKMATTLEEHREMLKIFREITEIHQAVPMDVSIDDLKPATPDLAELEAFADEMNFGPRIRQRMAKLGR